MRSRREGLTFSQALHEFLYRGSCSGRQTVLDSSRGSNPRLGGPDADFARTPCGQPWPQAAREPSPQAMRIRTPATGCAGCLPIAVSCRPFRACLFSPGRSVETAFANSSECHLTMRLRQERDRGAPTLVVTAVHVPEAYVRKCVRSGDERRFQRWSRRRRRARETGVGGSAKLSQLVCGRHRSV